MSRPAPTRGLGLAALCMSLAGLAWADDLRLPAQVPKTYQQECASCHLAYPPAALPAASWQAVMGGLARHHGVDASIEPEQVTALSQWLQTHAGTGRRMAQRPPEDRITRSAWFERKHRKIKAEVWQRASIGSPARCHACHLGAEQGRYDDDNIRISP